jgi:hypothetical protein
MRGFVIGTARPMTQHNPVLNIKPVMLCTT